MAKIQVLDQITIDKIAAGEVIERPASIVKELVENAIDAGASSVTVEIKEGGIAFIRITDNGSGINRLEVPDAFLRHATSKIRKAEDLSNVGTLGFRGEALSSIAAISQVELITKTKEDTTGTAYRIDGGQEISMEETGAPDGTTFLIRQLFYNTPARRKFLKTAMTEASHVGELLTKLALSHPEISFQFINNGQSKLHTSGNGNLKDVIYHVYGREIANHLLLVSLEKTGLCIRGFVGEPVISRGNRNYENCFINGRYVKSNVISKAIEDAYKECMMQHKYPFAVLLIEMEGESLDVNVHPTKMEVRFHNQQEVYNSVYEAVNAAIHNRELIPQIELPEPAVMIKKEGEKQSALHKKQSTIQEIPILPPEKPVQKDLDYFMTKMKERVNAYHAQQSEAEIKGSTELSQPIVQTERVKEAAIYRKAEKEETKERTLAKQIHLFKDQLLDASEALGHVIIGQVFDTYWLVEYQNQLYIIDQHAAHERVLYEKTIKGMKTREFTSQNISPPIILELSMQELELLNTYMEKFTAIGFVFEEFGQESVAVRAVPDNLFGVAKKTLLIEMLDSLSDELYTGLTQEVIDEKIASMSCKAAVKGNNKLSANEVDALIQELLTLENPYHCPHGRPTIIAMSKRELEKKFKRIV